MIPDGQTNEATRRHEAGHVVAALVLAIPISSVEVGPRDWDGGRTTFQKDLTPHEMLRVVVSGPLSEHGVSRPLWLNPASTDARLAQEALAKILGHEPEGPSGCREFWRACSWARTALQEHMDFLADLAVILGWRLRLGGKEIARLWDAHERDRTRWGLTTGAWR